MVSKPRHIPQQCVGDAGGFQAPGYLFGSAHRKDILDFPLQLLCVFDAQGIPFKPRVGHQVGLPQDLGAELFPFAFVLLAEEDLSAAFTAEGAIRSDGSVTGARSLGRNSAVH